MSALSTFRDNIGTTAKEGGIKSTQEDLASAVGAVMFQFLGLLGIVLVSYMVYGGYIWMTAQGSEEKVKQAKTIIRNGIIGIIIVFSSAVIMGVTTRIIALSGLSAPGASTSSGDAEILDPWEGEP